MGEKLQVYQTLTQVWAAHLDEYEFKLLAWLIGNTISRGNRSGYSSLVQFQNGVSRRDGGRWTAGTGISRAQITRITSRLRNKGLIHTRKAQHGNVLTVNLTWMPKGQTKETNVVKFPKRIREQLQNADFATEVEGGAPSRAQEWATLEQTVTRPGSGSRKDAQHAPLELIDEGELATGPSFAPTDRPSDLMAEVCSLQLD